MPRFLRQSLVTTTLLLCASLTACGGGGEGAADPAPAPGAGDRRELPARPFGGAVTQLSPVDVDSLDPGRTYGQLGFQIAAATHRTLYTHRPGAPSDLAPDLATGAPEISDDARTVTVRLREGVRFAPPVSREVVAADVRYAVERSLSANVGRPYPHLAVIEGASALPGPIRRLAGIATPDRRTIVFRLATPVGAAFAAALVLPATAPVPPEYAREHDARSPSTYAENVIATGPYRVASAPTGRVLGLDPGRRIRLLRNPAWDPRTDERPAHLERIDIETDATDVERATARVLEDDGLLLGTAPARSALPAVGRARGQHEVVASGGFRYLPLDTRRGPFRDVNVRRAVLAAHDRAEALERAGGPLVGEVATHFLPPDVPGFEAAGGRRATVATMRAANGDAALAARHMRAAGFASGRYEGDETVVVAGPNVEPGRGQAELAATTLEGLGFTVRRRFVPEDAFYGDVCARPSGRVDLCAGVGWFRDFNDPQSMLEPRFRGGSPFNLSALRDPALDRAMASAAPLTGAARRAAWGRIDRRIVALAAGVPLRWERQAIVWSADVDGVANPYTALPDLAHTRLRGR